MGPLLPSTIYIATMPKHVALSDGVVLLGVNPMGNLIVPGRTRPSQSSQADLGLRCLPTSDDALAPDCDCEGWGVAKILHTGRSTGYIDTDSGDVRAAHPRVHLCR